MQRRSRSHRSSAPPITAAILTTVTMLLTGCARQPQPAGSPDIDPEIVAGIGRIRAIDDHAHPVRVVGNGEQDRDFDALPVDNMEPSSDPMYLRPGDPGV